MNKHTPNPTFVFITFLFIILEQTFLLFFA